VIFEALELGGERPRGAHRHAGEQLPAGLVQTDRPVPPVDSRTHYCVAVGDTREGPVQQRRPQLRRVHADEQRGLADVLERRGQPLIEALAALRDHLEAAR
jgi:hypothetical protein